MKLYFLSKLVRYLKRQYQARRIREDPETDTKQQYRKNEIGRTYSEVVE